MISKSRALFSSTASTVKYYRENCLVPAGALPNTEWNSERIFSLPFFPGMSDADVDDVIEACKEILAR